MNKPLSCMRRGYFIGCTLLMVALSWNGWTRQGDPPLSLTEPALKRLDTVTVLSLPAIDRQRSLAEDAQVQGKKPAPLRYAIPQTVAVTPQRHGTWETLADGTRLWRQRIVCPGATDLNLGFSRYRLPQGARLYVMSEEQRYYEGPYEASDNQAHGQLWLPVIPGEKALIELSVPASVAAEVQLELSHVGCGYRSLFEHPNLNAVPKQGACNIDVVCPEGDGWRDQIRSVARYSIGGSGLCTGTLVRDVAGASRHFFLTAHHCGVTSSRAPSVVVYWNYQSPTCGQLSGGSLAQNQTGSTLRASRSDVDMTLLELSTAPSSSFNVFYSGWDRSGTIPSGAVGIHHPNGDEKSISFENDALSTINSCIGTGGRNTHWRVIWNRGVTEPGSSGSGLWEVTNKRLIGFLSGGESSCATPTAYDCYGKLSVAWDGSAAASRLRDWLDPTNTGTMAVNGMNPSGTTCTYTLNPTSASPGASGGSGSVSVTAGSGCAWTATSNAGWISITSGSSGSGNGTVGYSVQANTSSNPRTGTLTIAGQSVTITQAGGGGGSQTVTFNDSPNLSVPDNNSTGVSRTINVTNALTITSVSASVNITHPYRGDLQVELISPTGTTVRLHDRAGGSADNLIQTFGPLTTFNNQSSAGNWRMVVRDLATQDVGRWNSWSLSITGTGGGTCTYTLNPTSASPGASGGSGSVSVTAGSGCAWTATSSASWISITSGSSGSGNGTVGYSVQANTGSARTGTLTIAGHTFTVTQAAGAPSCTYSLTHSGSTFDNTAWSDMVVGVITPSGCTWSTTSNASWITLLSSSGSGNGRIRFNISANTTGSPRTGQLTIGGQTFTIQQAR